MKNLVLLSVLVCSVLMSSAQKNVPLYTTMANELCKQIKEKQAELIQSDNVQMDLGLMMLPIFMQYESELKKVVPDLDLSNEKQLELLGIEIGKKMVACPEFLKIISANQELLQVAKEGAAVLSIQGTLAAITPGEFTSITVKTSSGKLEKLWWMEYFPGEQKLNVDLLNQKVNVSYIEKEVYNAVLKDYIKIKVVTGIE